MQSFAISLPPPSASVTSSQSPTTLRPGAQEALKKGLTAAQETITELRAQLEESAQRAAFAQKEHERLREAQKAEHEREMQKLQAELETLRAQAEEYGRVKAHIADIELSARERADALDAATRAKLQSHIAACTQQCARVLATLGNTCESVSTALRHADAARVAAARRVHHAGRPARRTQEVRAITKSAKGVRSRWERTPLYDKAAYWSKSSANSSKRSRRSSPAAVRK